MFPAIFVIIDSSAGTSKQSDVVECFLSPSIVCFNAGNSFFR